MKKWQQHRRCAGFRYFNQRKLRTAVVQTVSRTMSESKRRVVIWIAIFQKLFVKRFEMFLQFFDSVQKRLGVSQHLTKDRSFQIMFEFCHAIEQCLKIAVDVLSPCYLYSVSKCIFLHPVSAEIFMVLL